MSNKVEISGIEIKIDGKPVVLEMEAAWSLMCELESLLLRDMDGIEPEPESEQLPNPICKSCESDSTDSAVPMNIPHPVWWGAY